MSAASQWQDYAPPTKEGEWQDYEEPKVPAPNAGLAPAANSHIKPEFEAPTAGLPGSSPNPQPATEGMTTAAGLGIGAAAGGIYGPAALRMAKPYILPAVASYGISRARDLPVVGPVLKHIPFAEMIPWMAMGKGEEEPSPPEARIPTPPPIMRGAPEMPAVTPAGDPIAARLRNFAAKIEAKGHGPEPPAPDESIPLTNAESDLTPALKKSLAKVRAAKRAGKTAKAGD